MYVFCEYMNCESYCIMCYVIDRLINKCFDTYNNMNTEKICIYKFLTDISAVHINI